MKFDPVFRSNHFKTSINLTQPCPPPTVGREALLALCHWLAGRHEREEPCSGSALAATASDKTGGGHADPGSNGWSPIGDQPGHGKAGS